MATSGKKFYESAQFKALNSEWRDKLREYGFRDAESPDGEYLNDDHGRHIFHLDHLNLEKQEWILQRGKEYLSAHQALESELDDAFDYPEVWEHLDPRVIKLVALIVKASWELGTAARHLGVSQLRAKRWLKEVQTRVAALKATKDGGGNA
jgi:hypothetical protein